MFCPEKTDHGGYGRVMVNGERKYLFLAKDEASQIISLVERRGLSLGSEILKEVLLRFQEKVTDLVNGPRSLSGSHAFALSKVTLEDQLSTFSLTAILGTVSGSGKRKGGDVLNSDSDESLEGKTPLKALAGGNPKSPVTCTEDHSYETVCNKNHARKKAKSDERKKKKENKAKGPRDAPLKAGGKTSILKNSSSKK